MSLSAFRAEVRRLAAEIGVDEATIWRLPVSLVAAYGRAMARRRLS